MIWALISITFAILIGLRAIHHDLSELRDTIETEGGAIVTGLKRIADALEWSNDNPRERV